MCLHLCQTTCSITDLLEELREIDLANQIGSLLGWDQEVIMPKNGASSRAEHLAWISKTVHEKISNPRIGELIASLKMKIWMRYKQQTSESRRRCMKERHACRLSSWRSSQDSNRKHTIRGRKQERKTTSPSFGTISQNLDMTRRKADILDTRIHHIMLF